ncbi:MAG: PspC domain-containing protein, partial [Acidimicrobiales bacterium]
MNPTHDPLSGPFPLARSDHDRILGGVCGGLAAHFGIDPVVIRILAVALAFLGGVGVLLYVAAWLVLPDEGGAAVGRRSTAGKVLLAVVGGLALLTAVSWLWSGLFGFGRPGDHGWGLLPLLLVAGVVGLVVYRDRLGLGARRPPGPPWGGGSGPWGGGSGPRGGGSGSSSGGSGPWGGGSGPRAGGSDPWAGGSGPSSGGSGPWGGGGGSGPGQGAPPSGEMPGEPWPSGPAPS